MMYTKFNSTAEKSSSRKVFSGFSSNELVEVQHGWMIHVQEFLRKVLVAFLYAEESNDLIYAHNNNISNVIPQAEFGNARMFTDLTAAFVGGYRGCLMILSMHTPRGNSCYYRHGGESYCN